MHPRPLVILPADRAFEAKAVCECAGTVCTCVLPDGLDMIDFWIIGKAAIATWGRELYECEQLRKGMK